MAEHQFSYHSDEEDDIESLRLAALKSLVKNGDTSWDSPNEIGIFCPNSANYRPSSNEVLSHNSYSENIEIHTSSNVLPHLNISNTYNAQTIPPITENRYNKDDDWKSHSTVINYAPYVPTAINNKSGPIITNVQLSPRSRAFVAENNDILMRRKVKYRSPVPRQNSDYTKCGTALSRGFSNSYKNSSLSPSYTPNSPQMGTSFDKRIISERWSRSPSPLPKNYLGVPSSRRSRSRSISSKNSPQNRHRSISNSPSLQQRPRNSTKGYDGLRYSPKSPRKHSPKRIKSRSPYNIKRKSPIKRHLSRSPIPSHSRQENRILRSPLRTYNGKRKSPLINQINSLNIRQSLSPCSKNSYRGFKNETIGKHQNKKRSPLQSKFRDTPPRIRSRSRSNPRQLGRSVRKNVASSSNRHWPIGKIKKQRYNGAINNYRNRRSRTPIHRRLRKSRTRSCDRNEKYNNRLINQEIKDSNRLNARSQPEKEKLLNDNESDKSTVNKCYSNLQSRTPLSNEKIKNDVNCEENLNKTNEPIKDDETSDNDDDGIDLFASDESESENEGRFKLVSTKNERNTNAPTLSYAKLNALSSTKIFQDLKELDTLKESNQARNSRDRNRTDYNSKNDRYQRLEKNTHKIKQKDYNKVKSSRNERYDFKGHEKKKYDSRSTFESVKNSEDVEKSQKIISKIEDRNKNSSVNLKQKANKGQGSEEDDNIDAQISSLEQSSSNSKKPIHLRLGAMTNTFKSSKKAADWNSEKV